MEMNTRLGLLVALLLCAATSSAQEKVAFTSLQNAWKSVEGKCGSVKKEEGGIYNFTIDPNNPGRWCVVSVGLDHVVVAADEKGRHPYTVIPYERIILEVYK